MEALEKAISIISAASGADAASVAERLTTDTDADALASDLFEPKYKEQRDQGHKIGTDKTLRKVKEAFKAAGVATVSLDALADALTEVQTAATASNPAALTPEQLLKQKPVVDALNAERLKTEAAVADAEKRVRGELETERQAFTKQRTEAALRAAFTAEIDKLNPNFTPGKEAAQKERLIKELLADGDYTLSESGAIQLVDADGNVLPGKLGNGVAKYEDRVRERAEDVYGLPASSPRETAGLTQEQIDAARRSGAYAGPKTDDELATEIIKHQDDPTKVDQLQADFKANITDKQST